jgi:hypothetical protein
MTFPLNDGNMTMIAKFIIEDKKISRISYFPCLINAKNQAESLHNDERGRQVFEYMDNITRGANLNAHYRWEGDEIVIY